eukprot:scaffold9928_cov112-Isochrysis_galbana.AAC.4
MPLQITTNHRGVAAQWRTTRSDTAPAIAMHAAPSATLAITLLGGRDAGWIVRTASSHASFPRRPCCLLESCPPAALPSTPAGWSLGLHP